MSCDVHVFEQDGSVSFQGPNYSSASYSRQLGPGGYPGQEPRFDQFGNPIPSTRAGLEGPYGTVSMLKVEAI